MSQELMRQLEHLHAELARQSSLDPETEKSLRALLAEIPAALEKSRLERTEGGGSNADVAERLQQLVLGFEARHPQLTATLTRFASGLADLGI